MNAPLAKLATARGIALALVEAWVEGRDPSSIEAQAPEHLLPIAKTAAKNGCEMIKHWARRHVEQGVPITSMPEPLRPLVRAYLFRKRS
ncbi:MAG: hypothetical protein AAGI11_15040 [Pseudomonadota bacterium]